MQQDQVQHKHTPTREAPELATHPRAQDWQTWQYLASTTSHAFSTVDQQLRKTCHLSLSDFDVLATLRRHEGNQATMACLTATVVVTLSGLSRSVSRLEEAGLVVKQPAQHDKRSMLITLTEQGKQVLHEAMPVHNRVIEQQVLGKLSVEQRNQLADIVTTICDSQGTQQ